MDGSQFDNLVKRLSTTRVTRLHALRELAVGAVASLTGMSLLGQEGEAKKGGKKTRKRRICHRTSATDPGVSKKLKKDKAKRHLRKHEFDTKGRCATLCDVCTVPGNCPHTSIQAAHDAANAGDTLTLCAGTYTENVTIRKSLTLASHPGHNVVLQGAGSGSAIAVQPGVTTTRNDLAPQATASGSVVTIQSGVTTTLTKVFISGGTGTLIDGTLSGGGIVNFGTLTLNGGTVVDANTAARGGGIYNATNGTLAILDGSFVARNTASSDGGGIYNARGATLTIDNAVVGKNTATGNGGGIVNSGGFATVKIQNNAQIEENTAAQGAGIYTDVGGQDSPGTTIVTIIDSSVTQNQASQVGGGIFNVAATVHLQTSTVFNNVATVTGGGILNTEGGVVTFDAQSAVLDNRPNNCVGTDACPA